MDLELISFKLCPYVQRSVITLLYKDAPYRITYIDISDPPPWFLDISPFGKVPVLRVDDDTVIFESAVINEFVDESTAGRLLPEDPLRRALNRSWIEFGSACIVDVSTMAMAKTRERFEAARDSLVDKFDRLEETLGEGPYFNGAEFSLTDAAYAPLFMRLELLRGMVDVYDGADYPRTCAWSRALLDMDAVQRSVVPELPDLYRGMIRRRGGYVGSLLGD